MTDLCYVPGTNIESERIMSEAARAHGYVVQMNTRGEWRAIRHDRMEGYIECKRAPNGDPIPYRSRAFRHANLEPLRLAMAAGLAAAQVTSTKHQGI